MLWLATGAPLPRGGWEHARSSDSQPKPALATGCGGRACRFGTRPVLPAHWGPAPLWRAAGAPLPNRGPGSHALARPEPPLPSGGPGSSTLPWRVTRVPPAHRRPGTHAPLWRSAGAPLLKKQFSSNINQNCIWLMFDIKCQSKLYLVDV